jgi:tetratricopeptide (TPR) repeat protein
MYGAILLSAGKFNEAMAACITGIDLDANSYISHLYKGWTHLALHQFDEAAGAFSRLMKVSKRHHFSTNSLILTYYFMGKTDEARILLDELKSRPEEEYVGYASAALSVALLDGVDEALIYLENAYKDRDPILLNLKYNTLVSPTLRADPRFQKLLNRVGFP